MVATGSGQKSGILTSKSDETIMREAELLALRSISDTLAALHQEMGAYRETMAVMREDMAVIKERQHQHSEFRESIKELTSEFRESIKDLGQQFQRGLDALENRVNLLEDRNLKQDGAVTFFTLLKDFGPWLVTGFAILWSFFRAP